MIELIYNQQTPKATKQVDLFPANITLLYSVLGFAKSLDNCAGLSANQLAFNGERIKLQAFVMNTKAPEGKEWMLMINPKLTIVEDSFKKLCHEECKTWINKTIAVQRYSECELHFTTIDGHTERAAFEGFQAQIVQHEMNHILGVKETFTSQFKGKRYPGGRNDLCPCGSGIKYKKCCW